MQATITKAFTAAEIHRQACLILEDHLVLDPDWIDLNALLMEDYGADSLDAYELALAIEEAFGVEVPDDAWEKLSRAKDIVSFVTESLTADRRFASDSGKDERVS
jgi:acyl carrier protein